MFRRATSPLGRPLLAARSRCSSTDLPAAHTTDSNFVEAWKKVSPNIDPPRTPLAFMTPRLAAPSSIPSKLTVNFVLPYASQLSGKEWSSTKLYQGGMFQKHRYLSTVTTNNSSEEGSEQEETISVTFVNKDGEEKQIKVPIGMSMLEAAHENDIELEGACEGSLACSTCHVIVMDVDYYNKLEEPTDEENDMLDLAFGLTETSRLGCQLIAEPELDGIRLAIPSATRNFAVDGFVPKPH